MSKTVFRRIPRSPCTWCGCLFFNGHSSGEIHCAECESGDCDNLAVLANRGGLVSPQALAGRRRLEEAGYVCRWTLKLDDAYTGDETSRPAHIYPEIIWRSHES